MVSGKIKYFVSVLLIAVSIFLPKVSLSQSKAEIPDTVCTITIPTNVIYLDALTDYSFIEPGAVVCLESGIRTALEIRNFKGTVDQPITFINSGGTVSITNNRWAAVQIRNSEHVRITGTGTTAECGSKYSITSQNCGMVIYGGSEIGVMAYEGSRYLELDNLEIKDTSMIGLHSKSGPSEGFYRSSWTQYDTWVHDNYIHNITTEGIYLGYSRYNDVSDYPTLVGVKVYNNLITDTGWDGLQVGSAVEDCAIYGNKIFRDSNAQNLEQDSGIMLNRGSVCDVYNNYLQGGYSSFGIYVQGSGGNQIYNNIILDRTQIDGSGIAIDTGSNTSNSIHIWNNTIVNVKHKGIRFSNVLGNDNQIKNNIVADVKSGDYINAGIAESSNNITTPDINFVLFIDPFDDNYRLDLGSPAIDTGDNVSISFDYDGNSRKVGDNIDVGAYEYGTATSLPIYEYILHIPIIVN